PLLRAAHAGERPRDVPNVTERLTGSWWDRTLMLRGPARDRLRTAAAQSQNRQEGNIHDQTTPLASATLRPRAYLGFGSDYRRGDDRRVRQGGLRHVERLQCGGRDRRGGRVCVWSGPETGLHR